MKNRFHLQIRVLSLLLVTILIVPLSGCFGGKPVQPPASQAGMDYYNALTQREQLLYYTLQRTVAAFDEQSGRIGGNYGQGEWQDVIDAFTADRPDVFYVDFSQSRLELSDKFTRIDVAYTALLQPPDTIKFTGGYTRADYMSQSAGVLAHQLSTYAAPYLSDIDKQAAPAQDQGADDAQYVLARAIHDTLTARLTRQLGGASASQGAPTQQDDTIYGAFKDGVATGLGYAEAYKYLLQQRGGNCLVVLGDADGAPQAWDAQVIGGYAYYTDVFADDIYVPALGQALNSHAYLLLGADDMGLDHTPSALSAGVLGGLATGVGAPPYNWYQANGLYISAGDSTALAALFTEMYNVNNLSGLSVEIQKDPSVDEAALTDLAVNAILAAKDGGGCAGLREQCVIYPVNSARNIYLLTLAMT